MKAGIVLSFTILCVYLCVRPVSAEAQTQPLGKVIGNQTVVSVPVGPPGYPTAQALIYYPDDYNSPSNANKKYPLFIFLHGMGEGSSQDITEVTNTSLPQLIAQGLKPYGIDPATGDTIKWIIVSPHCASCGGSYSYPQLQYTIPSVMSTYRVDPSCVWVGGLSAGGSATWSCAMGQNPGDTLLGKKLAGIMPIANGGYDMYITTAGGNLDAMLKGGLGVLTTIGTQDQGYNPSAFGLYWSHVTTNGVPGHYFDSVIINGAHNAGVWNLPFPLTARLWSKTMNSWSQMWTLRKNASVVQPVPAVTANAGSAQTITLPASSVTLSGTGTATNTTVASYQWTKTSGGSATISNASAASTSITGLTQGTYVFTLKVTGASGITATSTVQITVNAAANVAPVANAGAAQTITLPIAAVTLSGTGTDADGSIASYAWSKVSGGPAVIASVGSALTLVTGLTQGAYVFRLTVTDNKGATSTSDVQVGVNAAAAVTSPSSTTTTSSGLVVKKVACSEYLAAYLYSDGSVRSFVFGPDGHVELTPYQLGGRKAVDASTGFNRITILDDQGYVWINDLGKSTTAMFGTDTTGAAFNGNTSIYGFFYTYLSIRSDGTIWYWGGDDYKFYYPNGGATINHPIKLNQPAGVQFVKLAAGNMLLGLTSTGDVYQWSRGSKNFVKVTLPKPASDIASSNTDFAIAIVPDDITTSKAGWPYAWGFESRFWGGNGSTYLPSAPQAVKTLWNTTNPIQRITASHNVIHYIDSQGDLYGIGDNPMGEVGNGQELVNHAEKYPTPYAWSWTKYENLTGAPAIHVAPGVKFKDIFTGPTYVFYHYALATNDSLYFWGRNKSFVGGDGAVNNTEATYPDALDVLTPSMRTPLKIAPTQTIGYNFTPYTLKVPAKQTISGITATLSATATPSTLTASGFPNYGYTITKYQWTKVSGPTSFSLTSPTALTSAITGLVSGTYVFSIQTTDNNTGTITAYDTIVVNTGGVVIPGPPGASAGSDQTITAPASSVTLTGTGLETNGTITGYKWTEVSGPNTAAFGNASAAQTTVSNLIAGAYVFQLTVTDKSGLTASDQVKVTVNPASGTSTFSVSAGPDMTIILPTNSVNISGAAATVSGETVASCKWTQVSGPSTAVISGSGSITPTVSSLIQGAYVFQVLLTSTSGNTSSDQMKVTVNSLTTGTFIAYAGPDMTITLPTSSVKIAGVATVKGETVATCKWTQVSGPSASNISGGGSIAPTVSNLVQGVYVIQVALTSVSGLSTSDQMTITVNAAKAAVVNASASEASALTLDSTSNDVRTVKAYPNPVTVDQQITVEGQGWKEGTLKFLIYDINGRVVKQSVLENTATYFRQTIPVAGLVKGLYMLAILTEGDKKPKVIKFIIQ